MKAVLPSRCPECARAFQTRDGRRCKFCGCVAVVDEAPPGPPAAAAAASSPPPPRPAPRPPPRPAPPGPALPTVHEYVPLGDDSSASVAAPGRRTPLEDPRFGVDRAALEEAARDRFRRGLLYLGLGVGALVFAIVAGKVTGRGGNVWFYALALLSILRGAQLAISRGDGSPD